MQSLLAIARLVRLPLLFTALADASVVVLLTRGFDWRALSAVWAAAAGLYVFGMAGNDAMDAPADRARPSGPGRVNPVAAGELPRALAAVIALAGATLAVGVAAVCATVNIRFTLIAIGAIAIYNGLAKRWPPAGLLLLGVVRAANAAQGLTGDWTVAWWLAPALIGAHVVFVSAFAYAWEAKRPRLTWFGTVILIGACFAAAVGLIAADMFGRVALWPATPGRLWIVAVAWGLFLLLFAAIARKAPRSQRGPLLIFTGLSWLIVLDWSFLLAADVCEGGLLMAALLGGELLSRRLTRRAVPTSG